MNLLHASVHHQTFGQGEIMEINDDTISVSFNKNTGRKKSLFPSSFSQHLTLDNELLNQEMIEFSKQNHIQVTEQQQRAERSDRIAQFRANSIEKAAGLPKSKRKK